MFKNIGNRAVQSMGAKAIMGLVAAIVITIVTQVRNCKRDLPDNMPNLVKISLTELVAKGIPKEPGEINSYFLLSDTLTIDSVIISLPAFASSGLKVYPYKGAVDSQKFSIDPFNEYFYCENGKNERIYITCNVHGEIIEIK